MGKLNRITQGVSFGAAVVVQTCFKFGGCFFFFFPLWYSSIEKQPRHPSKQITTVLYMTVHCSKYFW